MALQVAYIWCFVGLVAHTGTARVMSYLGVEVMEAFWYFLSGS